jgi:cytochrome c oxidase subunit IV
MNRMTRVSPFMTTLAGIAVLALWGASWALSYVDLGGWSLILALAIASMKAALVVLVFMELVVERPSVHATLAIGLAMVLVLIAFMVADVRTREVPLRAQPVSAR